MNVFGGGMMNEMNYTDLFEWNNMMRRIFIYSFYILHIDYLLYSSKTNALQISISYIPF